MANDAQKEVAKLVDAANLFMAYEACLRFIQSLEQAEDKTKQQQRAQLGKHSVKAGALLKRMNAEANEVFEKHVGPIVERSDAARLKPLYRRATIGGPEQSVRNKAAFFDVLFPWLKKRPVVFRDLFAGRARRGAMQVAMVSEEEEPTARLNKLAAMPSATGRKRSRNWVMQAAALAGVPVTDIEETMADAETAAVVGEGIRDLNERIAASDPLSEQAADLQAEKQVLNDQLQTVVEGSKDPTITLGAGVAAATQQPQSKVAVKAGLSDEQTDAMLAEGKVVIAAGAGSGKTQTLAAKVAYLIEEKGYRPSQVMATTFTKKAAMELQERIEGPFGVHGAKVGTTHSIAMKTVLDYRPDLKEAIGNVKKVGSLMNIAIKQVGMLPGGGSNIGGGMAMGRRAAKKSQSPYWKEPIGDWFNLGDMPVDNQGRKASQSRIANVVDMYQMKGVTPEQAFADAKASGTSQIEYYAAAAYGAYEWLKKNDPGYGPAMDFTDFLSTAVEIFETNPQALKAVQSQIKVLLIDEAQDLNAMQHKLFTLMGGGADTMAYIGDDKQAIYGWRGAVPEEFTDLPNKGFNTKLMTMNYRSGKNIVDAANRLIAHNEDRQIPMVCKANVEDRGMGQIRAETPDTHQEAAKEVSLKIKAALDEAKSVEQGGVPVGDNVTENDFGILCRTNAEKDAYELSLITRGIPYRSKNSYFNKPIVKGITAWFKVATASDTKSKNDAVVSVLKGQIPKFRLGNAFVSALQSGTPRGENYLDFLIGGGYPMGNRGRPYAGRGVDLFAAALGQIRDIAASGESPELINTVLMIEGYDGSFMDALLDQVDVEALAEEEGEIEVTDEQIKEAAMVPLQPLQGAASHFTDPERMVDFIQKLERANKKNHRGKSSEKSNEPAVQIDTIHQWKGLERKHVFVSMSGGVFPNFRHEQAFAEGDEKALDEERRLAYVALTRGRDSVTVMSPKENYLGKPASISRFIGEACIGVGSEEKAIPDPDANDNLRESSEPDTWRSFVASLDAAMSGGDIDIEAADEFDDYDELDLAAEIEDVMDSLNED